MGTKRALLVLMMLPGAFACGPGEDPRAGDPAGEPVVTGGPQNAGMGAMAAPIAMRQVQESGVTGQATITPRGTGSEITIQLWGLSAETYPGHIHEGSCEAIGGVVVPLPEVTGAADGAGAVEVVLEEEPGVLAAENRIIVYHAPSGAPVACGELTPHAP